METISNVLLSIAWIGTAIRIVQEHQADITLWMTLIATALTILHRIVGLRKEYRESKKLKQNKNDQEGI